MPAECARPFIEPAAVLSRPLAASVRLGGGRWQAKLGLALLWGLVTVFLFLTLRSVPLVEIGLVLAKLNTVQVLVLLAANLLILALMAGRWALLLRALGHPLGLLELIGLRLAGFGVSYFTPGPQFGGEPLQVDLLRRRGVPLAEAISSVFLDRLVDLLGNFTFLVLGLTTLLASGVLSGQGSTSWAWLGAAVVMVLPLAHLASLWSGRQPLAWLLGQVPGRMAPAWLVRVRDLVRQSEAQISSLCRAQPGTLVQVILLSAVVWSLLIVEFALTAHFLGVEPGLIQIVSALTAARLAFLLPLPGGIGVLEAGLVFISQALGWGVPVGIALSLVIRARDVLLASLGMWLGGVAYRRTFVEQWISEKRS
jgi:glycosyltransferase 2 family protein